MVIREVMREVFKTPVKLTNLKPVEAGKQVRPILVVRKVVREVLNSLLNSSHLYFQTRLRAD